MLQWELPLCERDKGSERLTKCHCHACQWGWRLLTSPLGSGSTLCLFPFKNIFAALAPGFHPLNILAGAQCHLLKTIRPFTWFVVLTVCSHILSHIFFSTALWRLVPIHTIDTEDSLDSCLTTSRHSLDTSTSPADSLSASVPAFFLTDCLFESLFQGLKRLTDCLTLWLLHSCFWSESLDGLIWAPHAPMGSDTPLPRSHFLFLLLRHNNLPLGLHCCL